MTTEQASAAPAPFPAAPALEWLCDFSAELHPSMDVGRTPAGQRVIFPVKGGKVTGQKLSGEVLSGGGDWALVHADGFIQLDVRGTMRTDDGALLYVSYRGLVDSTTGYFRIQPVFETGSEPYRWLTRVLCVGVGRRTENGVAYSLFVVR